MNYLYNFFGSVTGWFYFFCWVLCFLAIEKKSIFIDRLATFCLIFFAFVFFGLRDRYSGTDTKNYLDYYDALGDGREIDFVMEPLFDFFSQGLLVLNSGRAYIFTLLAIQIVAIVLLSFFIRLRFFSTLLLMFVSFLPGLDLMTNGLRQGVGLSFVFLIWILAWGKGFPVRFSLLPAFLFHKSFYVFSAFSLFPVFKSEKILWRGSVFSIALATLIVMVWQVVDAASFAELLPELLGFSMVGTSLSFGEKAGVYIGSDQDILQGAYKYYFLFVSAFPAFLTFWYLKCSGFRKENELILFKVLFLLSVLLIPYAVAWPSPFGYRFMYNAYIPALVVWVLVSVRWNGWVRCGTMAVAFFSAVLVYGGSSYKNFNISF